MCTYIQGTPWPLGLLYGHVAGFVFPHGAVKVNEELTGGLGMGLLE